MINQVFASKVMDGLNTKLILCELYGMFHILNESPSKNL